MTDWSKLIGEQLGAKEAGDELESEIRKLAEYLNSLGFVGAHIDRTHFDAVRHLVVYPALRPGDRSYMLSYAVNPGRITVLSPDRVDLTSPEEVDAYLQAFVNETEFLHSLRIYRARLREPYHAALHTGSLANFRSNEDAMLELTQEAQALVSGSELGGSVSISARELSSSPFAPFDGQEGTYKYLNSSGLVVRISAIEEQGDGSIVIKGEKVDLEKELRGGAKK